MEIQPEGIPVFDLGLLDPSFRIEDEHLRLEPKAVYIYPTNDNEVIDHKYQIMDKIGYGGKLLLQYLQRHKTDSCIKAWSSLALKTSSTEVKQTVPSMPVFPLQSCSPTRYSTRHTPQQDATDINVLG
ncbi:hypothetical protein N7499_001511 [Penicillium canescens]|uniref:Uncharacterized protein n=1 Tax=Penicillium canescens TaxID=5083 RepID=A0AAD6I5U2_PENCN|nr:uncharacterized protein N7446_009050 [Penicillium canescens]KAJ6034302.1 hypothetical protein N7460_008477 [Penicillium canescens]KAJ6045965.1 hypothetical protein N7444_007219 [Penicillium canescens]KAJ6053038.1 hypothetical protein N7446_009050 [Penicillium canescens]KAJ6097137.1 hypothetical protein N7499_001511 [Penicillium canescens]KAJ6165126.1 hypothetical protein N7485_008370 [Penicillium canescens]